MHYDVVAFLKGLDNPLPDVSSDDLPSEWRRVYRECAATREASGGLHRELAEHYALLETLELMKAWEKSPRY